MKFNYLLAAVLFSMISPSVWAAGAIPECLDHNTAIAIDDAQVLKWKQSTPNQFAARGHVQGTVGQVFPDKNGHTHFEIKIGNDPADTLEIIYNQSFGALPALAAGMNVEACGDYITSTAQSGAYPPSPDGAILHWIHRSNNPSKHASGFVAIDGTVYGGQ